MRITRIEERSEGREERKEGRGRKWSLEEEKSEEKKGEHKINERQDNKSLSVHRRNHHFKYLGSLVNMQVGVVKANSIASVGMGKGMEIRKSLGGYLVQLYR